MRGRVLVLGSRRRIGQGSGQVHLHDLHHHLLINSTFCLPFESLLSQFVDVGHVLLLLKLLLSLGKGLRATNDLHITLVRLVLPLLHYT